jgi:hypothetical protein
MDKTTSQQICDNDSSVQDSLGQQTCDITGYCLIAKAVIQHSGTFNDIPSVVGQPE